MSVRTVKAGTTDVSVTVRIIDSTDGTPETGVVFNTAGIDLWYRRELEASTDITEATLAALTTAHSDGGFLHINDGVYRLDLPDAACAAGVAGVQIGGTVTGMVVLGPYIELPVNVEADTYGRVGAPAGASVSADVAAVKSDTAAILVDTGTTLQAEVDAIQAAVITNAAGVDIAADIIALKAETAAILVDTTEIGVAGAGLTNINLPDQTMAITGNITGNLSGSVGSVTGAVGSVAAGGIAATSFAAGAIDASAIAADAIGAAEIAAGAIDAATFAAGAIDATAVAAGAIDADALAADAVTEIWAKALAELAQAAPSATPSALDALAMLYMMARNAVTVDATTKTFSNDAGTVVFKKALSDDGTTYTEAEAVAGP